MSESEQVQDQGCCAAASCTKISSMKCSRCRVVYYCSRDCQKSHWKTHKDECRRWSQLNTDGLDLSDPETAMKAHHREFRRIVCQYGLDKDGKADKLADFLTNATANDSIAPEHAAEMLGIPALDAKTLLSWVDVGVRFKEQHLDGVNKEISKTT